MNPAAQVTPEGWPRGAGYAHAAAAHGRVLCTAGQIGWDPLTEKLVGRPVDVVRYRAIDAPVHRAATQDAW